MGDTLNLQSETQYNDSLTAIISNLNNKYHTLLAEDSLHSEFGYVFHNQLSNIKSLYEARLKE